MKPWSVCTAVLVRDRWLKSAEWTLPVKRAEVQRTERAQGQQSVPTQTGGQWGSEETGRRLGVSPKAQRRQERNLQGGKGARDLSSSEQEVRTLSRRSGGLS